MNSRSGLIRTLAYTWGAIAVSATPHLSLAQEVPLELEDGRPADMAALRAEYANSRFKLFGEGDRAVTGMRPTGSMEMFLTNTGIVDAADLNMDGQPDLRGCALCPTFTGFDTSPIYAAGRDEWLRFLSQVPELLNATGGGYAVSRNFPTLSRREILASDLQFGVLFSGVQSTTDGGCRDFSAIPEGSIAAGLTLLAGSPCPPTWPQVGGVPTFGGADPKPAGGINPVSKDAYLASLGSLGPDFNFEWWRVDPALVDPAKLFGNFSTYGAYDDFNSSMIGRFGNAVPGGSGAPAAQGWPLGLRTEFVGFNFALPTVANTLFWRAIIINETQKVYGVPLDYQNLYVGYTDNRAHIGSAQETSWYHEVWRGAIMSTESGAGNPICPGVPPPGVNGIDCPTNNLENGLGVGFQAGASAIIVLRSPIGDLRNVLLSCSPAENSARATGRAIPCPTDEFNSPASQFAGDTITYNHYTMCPFGAFCGSETMLGPDKRMYGALASNASDILDGRSVGQLQAGAQYSLFRNPNFPTQITPHAFWVPGTWDYSGNGANSPSGDTIWVPTCYGPIPGTARSDACAVTWSDTMPTGELGNPAYNNQEGNVSFWSVGPFALAAGDTTSLVIAKVHQVDSTTIETEVNNVIDLYMNFYLSPEAPPKVNIVGVDIQVENPAQGQGRGEVTLFWDDSSDDFVDPFLESFADNLAAAAPGTELGKIRGLNLDLEDRIRTRARDNLDEILIFKSCDGGLTFTAADVIPGTAVLDCDADQATDLDNSTIAAGWQSYAVLPVDAAGDAPNAFTDRLVLAGQSYIYNISGRSRGATFTIINGVDTSSPPDGVVDSLFTDSLVLAPELINPLATSPTEPNVASVYVPATTQAGAQPAQVVMVDSTGIATVPTTFQFTSQDPVEARYRAVVADQFEIISVAGAEGVIVSTTVTARDIVTAELDPVTTGPVIVDSVVVSSANPNGVQIAGTPTSSVTVGDTTTTVLDGLGFFMYRLDTDEPLFVSTVLDGENTTPPTLFGRVALDGFTGFPGFVLTADNTMGGQFDQSFYEVTAGGAQIPQQIIPTVAWDNQASIANQAGGISGFGRYEIEWSDLTFGSGSPFTLNKANRAETENAYVSSLEARSVALTGVTDAEAAALISPFLVSPITEDDLVAVRLPFEVHNTVFDRAVEVALVARPTSAVLLGDINTGDTLTVVAPEDAWIPGDLLFFLETVELDSIGSSGGVVLDASGKPIKVQRRAVTFGPAVLSCTNFPRASCNPVIGLGTTNDWVSNSAGQNLVANYFAPLNRDVSVTFDTQRGMAGEDAIAAGMDIAPQMDSIKVVPNPYVMFSKWQIASTSADDARLLFTHLPPRGNIRVFTVSGQFVQQIRWDPEDLDGNGDLFWNMRTREGTDIAGGLYIFVVEAINPATGSIVTKTGKFAVIR